jgi:hypothetical protein
VNAAGALEPNGVVTTTLTAPETCAGATTVNDVAEDTDSAVPATPPKDTDVVPARLVPVMVTVVPPAAGPDDGDTFVIAGGATYVNVRAALDPYGVVTTTSTGPATCAGDTTVNDVPELTERLVPATPSNVTAVAPVNAVPVSATVAPPAVEPDDGDTVVITGPDT